MIEKGHFQELENILRILPRQNTEQEEEAPSYATPLEEEPLVKRQTFIFSATITLSPEARQKIGSQHKTKKGPEQLKHKKKKGKDDPSKCRPPSPPSP